MYLLVILSDAEGDSLAGAATCWRILSDACLPARTTPTPLRRLGLGMCRHTYRLDRIQCTLIVVKQIQADVDR
jgi:hypothetical protein